MSWDIQRTLFSWISALLLHLGYWFDFKIFNSSSRKKLTSKDWTCTAMLTPTMFHHNDNDLQHSIWTHSCIKTFSALWLLMRRFPYIGPAVENVCWRVSSVYASRGSAMLAAFWSLRKRKEEKEEEDMNRNVTWVMIFWWQVAWIWKWFSLTLMNPLWACFLCTLMILVLNIAASEQASLTDGVKKKTSWLANTSVWCSSSVSRSIKAIVCNGFFLDS